jgi:hypothetical protein
MISTRYRHLTGLVTGWADKSGNGNHVVTPDTRSDIAKEANEGTVIDGVVRKPQPRLT